MSKHCEIGSEFWDVPVSELPNRLFFANVQWYLSGRSALAAIIAELGDCRTVAMPSWCCDSMIMPFADAGIEVRFYSVFHDETFASQPRTDCDALLVMDYFGYDIGCTKVPDGYGGVVIRDLTHSLLSGLPSDGEFCFGSLRKWCGLWTGGFAWATDRRRLDAGDSDTSGYVELRKRAMGLKARYIAECDEFDREIKPGKAYLRDFTEAEELLEGIGVHTAAMRDVELAKSMDVAYIKKRRRANARVLLDSLADWTIFSELDEGDCPLFVPIIVPNGRRDALRRFLIEREIYCPVHWPVSEWHSLGEDDRFVYDNGLSLVCDQRYGEEDMLRVIIAIKEFMKGGDGC